MKIDFLKPQTDWSSYLASSTHIFVPSCSVIFCQYEVLLTCLSDHGQGPPLSTMQRAGRISTVSVSEYCRGLLASSASLELYTPLHTRTMTQFEADYFSEGVIFISVTHNGLVQTPWQSALRQVRARVLVYSYYLGARELVLLDDR